MRIDSRRLDAYDAPVMHNAGVVAELHILSQLIQRSNRSRFRSPIVLQMLRALDREDWIAWNEGVMRAQQKQFAQCVELVDGLTTLQTREFWRVIVAWGRAYQSFCRWQDAHTHPGILRWRERFWEMATRRFVSRAYQHLRLL